ncbi:MAG: hypothetical protein DBX42_02305 [Azospirillum sp.]|nr:MAG: hypothetical protein DBX42_02305 [Azospirillum sp.]
MLKCLVKWVFNFIIVTLLFNIFYYNFFEKPSLVYSIQSTKISVPELQTSKHTLKVMVDNELVQDVFITTLILENNSPVVLERSLDKEKDPLMIVSNNIEFAHIDNSKSTKTSYVNLVENSEGLLVNFDFLNPNDRIYINLIHKQENQDFKVKGSFKGITEVKKKTVFSLLEYVEKNPRISGGVLMVLLIIGLLDLIYAICSLTNFVYNHIKKKIG